MKKVFYTTIISMIAIAMMTMSSISVLATNNYDSAQNHPSYWGDSCVKIDSYNGGIYFSTDDESVTKVVIKGGTTNKVYTVGPFMNLTAEINPNSGKPFEISHIITCSDEQGGDEPEVCAYDSSLSADHADCKPEEVCQYDSTLTSDDPDCEEPVTDDPSDDGGTGYVPSSGGNIDYASDDATDTPQVLAEGVTELPKTGVSLNPLYQFLLVTGVMTVILTSYKWVKERV